MEFDRLVNKYKNNPNMELSYSDAEYLISCGCGDYMYWDEDDKCFRLGN